MTPLALITAIDDVTLMVYSGEIEAQEAIQMILELLNEIDF